MILYTQKAISDGAISKRSPNSSNDGICTVIYSFYGCQFNGQKLNFIGFVCITVHTVGNNSSVAKWCGLHK